MPFRRRQWHWYDLLFLGLAAMAVYPDRILDWLGERTGKSFNWLHVALIELLAGALMFADMVWLMPIYPKLQWWHPLVYVGVVGIFRLLMWVITEMFGFND